MRFQFVVPEGEARIRVREGVVHEGASSAVFTLTAHDQDKALRLRWRGVTLYGRMAVMGHTPLTRVSVVPIQLTDEVLEAASGRRAVTYVVYARARDETTQPAGPVLRELLPGAGPPELRQLAEARGDVIAVLDFSNALYGP
jgi:hypothetical protein